MFDPTQNEPGDNTLEAEKSSITLFNGLKEIEGGKSEFTSIQTSPNISP